jgi:transcriptional regulator with XRE-family HTH domain
MSFGVKLKQLRQEVGLSQTQLASASGVPVGTIRDYEQSKRDPLLSSAQKLAEALGVSLDAFKDAGPAAKPDGKAAAGKSPRRKQG